MSSWARQAALLVQQAPKEFQRDRRGFDCTLTVARCLQESSTREIDELMALEGQLDGMVTQFVESNHHSFAASVRRFNEVNQQVKTSRTTVGELKKEVSDVIGGMVSHAGTARELDERLKAHTHLLAMLDEIAAVLATDDLVAKLVAEEKYVEAVRALDNYEQMVLTSYMTEVRSLSPLQSTVAERKERLYGRVVDRLKEALYGLRRPVQFDGEGKGPAEDDATAIPACLDALEVMGRLLDLGPVLEARVHADLRGVMEALLQAFTDWCSSTVSHARPTGPLTSDDEAFEAAQEQQHLLVRLVTAALQRFQAIHRHYIALYQQLGQRLDLRPRPLGQAGGAPLPADEERVAALRLSREDLRYIIRHLRDSERLTILVQHNHLLLAALPPCYAVLQGVDCQTRRVDYRSLSTDLAGKVGEQAMEEGTTDTRVVEAAISDLQTELLSAVFQLYAAQYRHAAKGLDIRTPWEAIQLQVERLLKGVLAVSNEAPKRGLPLHHTFAKSLAAESLEALLLRRTEDGLPKFMSRGTHIAFQFLGSNLAQAPDPAQEDPDTEAEAPLKSLTSVLGIIRPTVYNSPGVYKLVVDFDLLAAQEQTVLPIPDEDAVDKDTAHSLLQLMLKAVDDDLMPRVGISCRRQLGALLEGPNAFAPHLTKEAAGPPPLLSAHRAVQLCRRLLLLVGQMRQHRPKLLALAEELLGLLLATCEAKVRSIVAGQHCGAVLAPVWDAALSRPAHNRGPSTGSQPPAGQLWDTFLRLLADPTPSLHAELDTLIDGPLHVNPGHSIAVLDSAAALLTLALVAHSMQWTAQQLLGLAPLADPHGKAAVHSGATPTLADLQRVSSALATQHRRLGTLGEVATLALVVEARARCCHLLAGFAAHSYHQDTESLEPHGFVRRFGEDVTRLRSIAQQHLSRATQRLLLGTLPALVCGRLLHHLPAVPDKWVNRLGVRALRRDLFAIQQSMAGIEGASEECFGRVWQYYEMLTMTTQAILHTLETAPAAAPPPFSLPEYEAMLALRTDHRAPAPDDLARLRALYPRPA
eukprot:EG_transcript_1664